MANKYSFETLMNMGDKDLDTLFNLLTQWEAEAQSDKYISKVLSEFGTKARK